MHNFRAYITGLASVAFLFALSFDHGFTNNWRTNRVLIEQRVQLNHTNQENGEFYERSYNTNLVELEKFAKQVELEKKIYGIQ